MVVAKLRFFEVVVVGLAFCPFRRIARFAISTFRHLARYLHAPNHWNSTECVSSVRIRIDKESQTPTTLTLQDSFLPMQLIAPFDKRTKQGLGKSLLLLETKTMMAPNSARCKTELGASSDASAVVSRGIIGKVHPEEPLLYLIPDELKPTYRPLPLIVQVGVFLLSTWISAISTWKHVTFLQPLVVLRGWRPVASPSQFWAFVAKVSYRPNALGSHLLAVLSNRFVSP